MNRELAHETWKRFLSLTINGNPGEYLDNPLYECSKTANEGKSDDENGYKQQSFNFWRGQAKLPAAQLLINALTTTRISADYLEKISDLLASASEHTFYYSQETYERDKAYYGTENSIEAETHDDGWEFDDCTPKQIESWLHTTGGIVGQNTAVKAASLILHNHIKGRTSVNLFAAPTGSGKTQLWRALQKKCGDNIVIYDASTLTSEGWKGDNKISTLFKDIPEKKRGNIILVLDEFDKLLEPQYDSSGTNHTDLVQNQLLKLFDHDTLIFGSDRGKGFSVDTTGISIVLLGAFQRLLDKKSGDTGTIGFGGEPHHICDYSNTKITYEDLVEYGMREEIAGRITRITCMNPLTVDDIVRIGQNEVKNLEDSLDQKIEIDHEVLFSLAVTAEEKGLGARWLKSRLNIMLDELIYENPYAKTFKIDCSQFVDMTVKTSPAME